MAEFTIYRTRAMWLQEKAYIEAETKEQALEIAQSGDVDEWAFVHEEDQYDDEPEYEAGI